MLFDNKDMVRLQTAKKSQKQSLPLSLIIIVIIVKVTQGPAHLWFGCHIPLCSICTGGPRQSILKEISSSTAVSFTSTFGELDNSPWCR